MEEGDPVSEESFNFCTGELEQVLRTQVNEANYSSLLTDDLIGVIVVLREFASGDIRLGVNRVGVHNPLVTLEWCPSDDGRLFIQVFDEELEEEVFSCAL